MDYTNIPLGMRVQSQIPLDIKTYKQSEEELKNLGSNNNLAFTYIKGLIIYCVQEGTRYEWKEMTPDDIGLLDNNFVYPNNVVTFGIDYSNKEYNFVKVENAPTIEPPLELIDEGNGEGIIIRNRIPENYGSVGFRAVDFSKSDFPSTDYGAKGDYSFIGNGVYQIIGSDADYAFIGAGRGNEINALRAGIVSGSSNIISLYGESSIIGAGEGNTITDGVSLVGGSNGILAGINNLINGFRSIIGAGTNNKILGTSQNSGIFSGENQILQGNRAGILAGYQNKASQSNTAVLGGFNNEALGSGSQVVGNSSIANSYEEIALGSYGTTYIPTSTTAYNINDRQLNIGIGSEFGGRKDGLSLFKNGIVTIPSINNSLINSEPTGKVLITREYLDSIINSSNQLIINYPSDFTGINYTLLNTNNNKLIIIKNGSTDVTITVPTTLPEEFFASFIRTGSGEISFVTSGGSIINSSVGLKIDLQFDQVALDREGSTNTFYLTGNTKV